MKRGRGRAGRGAKRCHYIRDANLLKMWTKGKDLLAVKEGKNDGRDRLFLILEENVERVCLVGGEYKM